MPALKQRSAATIGKKLGAAEIIHMPQAQVAPPLSPYAPAIAEVGKHQSLRNQATLADAVSAKRRLQPVPGEGEKFPRSPACVRLNFRVRPLAFGSVASSGVNLWKILFTRFLSQDLRRTLNFGNG
jgi:hypothetical protein